MNKYYFVVKDVLGEKQEIHAHKWEFDPKRGHAVFLDETGDRVAVFTKFHSILRYKKPTS